MGGEEGTEGGVALADVPAVPVVVGVAGVLGAALFLYISSREPAPQYSYGLPGQMKLQSVRV